jgi:hypothetical protein
MPATLADIQKKYGDSVYPLYKDQMHEPYMENDNGIGYKGVVMYDEVGDKVQCAECGKWFKFLNGKHLKSHKMTSQFYKDKNGLFKKIALCSKVISATHSNTARKTIAKYGSPSHFGSYKTLNSVSAIKRESKIARKNQYGLCDAQIAARLVIVFKMSGKDSMEEVNNIDIGRFDRNLLDHLKRKYGNTELAVGALGLKHKKILNTQYEDAYLIGVLREFVIKNKRKPAAKEIDPSVQTYFKHFGSWRRAKTIAGLDQLLEEVKSA